MSGFSGNGLAVAGATLNVGYGYAAPMQANMQAVFKGLGSVVTWLGQDPLATGTGGLWILQNGVTPSGSNYTFIGDGSSLFLNAASANNLQINGSTIIGLTSAGAAVTGTLSGTSSILSGSASDGVGYATGAGGAVTQATSRTTGVALNKVTGAITLVSAAGSASFQSFTLTNSAIAATDIIKVNQKSGTDKYQIFVTNVAAGSCQITFATTGGTTTEQPVFNFAVIKGVTS